VRGAHEAVVLVDDGDGLGRARGASGALGLTPRPGRRPRRGCGLALRCSGIGLGFDSHVDQGYGASLGA
jgi:hypothetical protein